MRFECHTNITAGVVWSFPWHLASPAAGGEFAERTGLSASDVAAGTRNRDWAVCTKGRFILARAFVVRADTFVDAGAHRMVASWTTMKQARLPPSMVALSAATGVLVIAVAYTTGRLGYASSPWADHLYWLGQVLILVPSALCLLSRRVLTESGTLAVVVAFTVAEYLAKVCYSPAGFTYSDELSHWRTAENILQAGKLFTANDLLPISPRFPGLEEATTALVSITGLPLFTCGLIIAGLAHLLFVCTLYLFFGYVGGSHRLAGVAVLIYSSNPDLNYFDSIFAYQTLALALLGVALLAVWRLTEAETGEERVRWLIVAILVIAATVVTHHITSFILVAILALTATASILSHDRRSAGWSAALALWSAVVVAGWIGFVAPQTISYLWPTVEQVLQSFRELLTSGHPSASAAAGKPTSPSQDQAAAAGAVLVLSSLLPIGWWQVWRRYRQKSWVVALAIGSLSWYVIIGIRLAAPDGAELAGRAASFVFVPAGFIAALGLTSIIEWGLNWRPITVAAASLIGVLLMLFDGAINGWPPVWERLPGPHQVAGVERSVGPEEIAVSRWTLAALGPDNRFAVDFGNCPVLGSYGDQSPVLNVGFLYTSSAYTSSDIREVHALAIHYVLVDLRLSQSLPASGQYFPIDPDAGRYTHPIALADLNKFNQVPQVARIFDAGDVVIYDLGGESDAP
jgi:hypothetical protein